MRLLTIQWTTRITETGITNLTRITNEMATSSDYLMKYFNGFLAVFTGIMDKLSTTKKSIILVVDCI